MADLKGGAGDGPCVALRADIDALEIEEHTGLPFASRHKGFMHACGHDHHVTMLLGAVHMLAAHRNELKGKVRFIFQAQEEVVPIGGAYLLLQENVLDGVDAIFGLHVWPTLPEGVLGVRDGVQMASSDHFRIYIDGESCHGAMPDKGRDALLAGAALTQGIQTIISRNIDPLETGVVTIGVFEAGHQWNIVPGECFLEGTSRSFNTQIRDRVEGRMRELVEGIPAAYGCKGVLEYEEGHEPLVNHAGMAAYMRKIHGELFGEKKVDGTIAPAMTGEDFARYLSHCPGAFGWLGTHREGEVMHPLHSSLFEGNELVLSRGAALFTQLALRFAEEGTAFL